jgi:hypothetical protein
MYPPEDRDAGLSEEISNLIENQRRRITRMEDEHKQKMKDLKNKKKKS